MKFIKYTSLDTVFLSLIRMGFTELVEKDVVEWSALALEAIGCVNQYEEAVCFSKVINHQVTIPNGTHSVIQVARNHCHSEDCKYEVTPQVALDAFMSVDLEPAYGQKQPPPYPYLPEGAAITTTELSNPDPDQGVLLDCNGQPLLVNELAYYRPYFDLQWEYHPWTSSSLHHSCFEPVRLASHSFFNSIVCKENDHHQIYQNSRDEYTIVGGIQGNLRFSFPSGQIALAYTRVKVDKETGWPLIPDRVEFITALTYYNIFKFTEREFYLGRQGAQTRMEKAEQQWQWYCSQASTLALMPRGLDEMENIKNQRMYLLPRLNRYAGFFGKLGYPEERKFDNPNRFFPNSFFRGQR